MRVKKIHRLVYQEIFPPFCIALLVLTFVVFSREFGRLVELIIRKSAGAATVLELACSLLPSILIFSVPISFLIGALIGFSRLSSDSEIVALRANGVSVYQLIWPVLKVGVLVAGLTLVLTFLLLPEGNWNLRLLRQEIGLQPVRSEIKPRVFNEELSGMVLYVEDVELTTGSWRGVLLAESDGTEENKRIILARRGHLFLSPDGRRLQLHFENGTMYRFHLSAPEQASLSRFVTEDLQVEMPEIEPPQTKVKKPEDKTFQELALDLRQGEPQIRRQSLVELHSRTALPLSALIFAVLGVTLGSHPHRGGRGYGFIVSVVIAFVYYVLFATGTELSRSHGLPLLFGVWGANLIMLGVAVLSLRYPVTDTKLFQLMARLARPKGGWTRPGKWLRKAEAAGRELNLRLQSWFRKLPPLELRVARVIDLYMMRKFTLYFIPTLMVVMGLFFLFTFFELINDVLARNIPYSTLLEYFFFLTPQILLLLVPISVLIATLIAFGTLEKTNQMVAFKSSGISVYRLALPVLVLAAGVSGGIFIIQEHILPSANQRQDNLRNVIKGRPAQTYYQHGRNWIFGGEERLYHYSYFDPESGVFAELSLYRLDLENYRIRQHVYARRAEWDPVAEAWGLHRGWQRHFEEDGNGFNTFDQQLLFLPEYPEYFSREVKESSKMSYRELEAYIAGLQLGGFEVDHLRTELHKKISFPVVNLIMAFLGVPFALSVGRKGALYGIAAGVLIGIIYWGAFGLFGVLGVSGMLAPVMAAWGPNVVFATLTGLLLTRVRT